MNVIPATFRAYDGIRNASAAASLADGTFGVLLETPDGTVMDRVAVSEYADTACQDGDGAVHQHGAADGFDRTIDR